MSKLLTWREAIHVDLPEVGPITDRTRTVSIRESARFRGSVRVATGRFWTDREFAAYRDKVLNTPLP